jgi:hypothetical protein
MSVQIKSKLITFLLYFYLQFADALKNLNQIKSFMNNERVYKMTFAKVYPLYVAKAERKGRTQSEVNKIICWLTGYTESSLMEQIEKQCTLEEFFTQAPGINPKASLIKGLICGYRVEEIEDQLMQNIRRLDKLIDELAKGKAMEKILRA